MLKAGDMAPLVEGKSTDGARISLLEERGHPLVLYFFPRAGTPGCTRETRGFAQRFEELRTRGVGVIGVSTDPLTRQRAFAEECNTPFPLIPDPDRTFAQAFGVMGWMGMARRVTFLIGPDGRILEVVEGMRPGPHVDAATRRWGALPGSRSSSARPE